MLKKLFLFFALLCAVPCFAAHDASSNAGNAIGSATTFTWSHTCTGSNLLLKVAIVLRTQGGTGGGHPTAVSYNGVGLTEGIHVSPTAGTSPTFTYVGIWNLKAPATGTNTISVTISEAATSGQVYASADSFSGVDQTSPIEATQSATGTNNPITLSITTVNANAWIADAVSINQVAGSGSFNANSPQTGVYNSSLVNAATLATSYQGPVVTPASTSDGWTFSGTTIFGFIQVAESLKPAAGGGGGVVRRRASVIQ